MAFWLDFPLSVRVAVIVGCGFVLAGLANWVIYTLAYFPRPISPWAPPAAGAPPRRWYDRLPLVGWIGLRREAFLHGRWFWLRPLLIELLFPIALVAYYRYAVLDLSLVEAQLVPGINNVPGARLLVDQWMNFIFLGHALLATLMVAATFIDFDEQTVPDWITVPGTLLGLALGSGGYQLFMPYFTTGFSLEPVLFTTPGGNWGDRWSNATGLWLGWGLFTCWCFALADRRLILRRGVGKAVQYFFAGLVRHSSWKLLLLIWLAGLGWIGVVFWLGDNHWRGLLTSLVGMGVGGATVWSVRLVAGVAMRQEAMGFGDVTLMAMIGAFVGWQASLLAFVLAPFTAILIVLVQFALTRNRVTPFGPYLCAGTVVTILFWPRLWEYFGVPAFGLGAILPVILISLLCIMGVMLAVWRFIKQAIMG
ncbi:prepilin peptidase [Planctomycetaceae bacterium SH139]